MSKKIVIIDGNNFSDIEGFYNEIDKVLTKGLDWKTGHNLDAFNDILRGGFGVHEYEESIKIIWNNSKKSEKELNIIRNGKILFQELIDIIKEHRYIELSLT